ncbi:homocysteine S-methyltransferase family protein [soil metagenome]
MIPFADALRAGPVILMDGAMATELFKRGLAFTDPPERWNLERPEAIRDVHESFLAAGSTCILTNTFQANSIALARHGLENQLEDIVEKAVRIARDAAGSGRYVLASIGPVGVPYDASFLDRIIPALAGVDGILLETFSDSDVMWLVKYGVLPRLGEKQIPVLVSMSFAKSASGVIGSLAGLSAVAVARLASQYGLAGIGLNCGKDMALADATSVVADYRKTTELPVFARPNAGTPAETADGLVYPLQATDFAAWVPEMMRQGVRMIGGCCGSTPATITAMREVIDRWSGAEEVW